MQRIFRSIHIDNKLTPMRSCINQIVSGAVMLNLNNQIEFRPGIDVLAELRNFSDIEDGFAWQTGRWGEISFDFDQSVIQKASELDLIIDLDVYKHAEAMPGQNLFLYLNGLRFGSFYVTSRRVLIIGFSSTVLAARNTLTLDLPDAVCPKVHNLSDERILGAQLYSVQIRRSE